MSVEKDANAHKTLRLRSFFRKIVRANEGRVPSEYLAYMRTHDPSLLLVLQRRFEKEWEAAELEAVNDKLVEGDDSLVREGARRLKACGVESGPWVLIGGPPCQAYSLIGRSRRTSNKEVLESDERQTLYKCYLDFIRALKPTVFVMENVKGLLSARHSGEGVFGRICSDMQEAGYEVRSLVTAEAEGPKDYVVHAEKYGIPQARHRVILLGVKNDDPKASEILTPKALMTFRDALVGIPQVRSGFSRRNGGRSDDEWQDYIRSAINRMEQTDEGKRIKKALDGVKERDSPSVMTSNEVTGETGRYEGWYRGRMGASTVLSNHRSRRHLASDLDRYLYCSSYAEVFGTPAHIADFPRYLYPKHRNVLEAESPDQIIFADRFRVQLWDRPSTTVTSHIRKDGHYYIHPDPLQCRSLTVREAARLQTFPDDYFFEGSQTEQFGQVGNAVPPLLAQQIAKVVASYLGFESQGFCDTLAPA